MLKNPRAYDVVMLFNVNQNCEHCAEVESEYKKMVYSFVKSRGMDTTTKEKKIFFGVLYFNNKKEIQSIFKDHGFTTVPYLAVSAMDLKRDASKGKFYATDDQWLVNSQEVFGATKLIDWVNNHLKTDVSLKIPFSEIVFKNFLGLVIISMLFSFVKSIYPILLNQWVWFGIAITVYVVCTGGLVYSMINQTPWFKFEKNEYGSVVITEYFMRGQRGQWAGEGYLVSVLVTIIGLTYLYMNNVEHMIKTKSEIRMAVLCCLGGLFVMQQLLLVAYRIKSPWYHPGFMPPSYYQRGSLLQDQGNNI